jgi:diguanylate cyclase (GGDEF)-like protein
MQGRRPGSLVYDAGPRAWQGPSMQEPSVSTDASRDPRASLPRAIAVVADAADLEAILDGILAVAADAVGATMGAIFVSDPDRATLQLVSAHGMTVAAEGQLTKDAADPANPFAMAATDRTATFDIEATTPDGAAFVGSYLPLMVTTGGVTTSVGSLGLSWPAPRILDDAERDTVVALTRLAALAVDRARLASTAAERSEWFERMAHTDSLTGLANERTVGRILELEIARAARQGSELSLAMFDIDDFRATNRDSGHEAGDDVLRRVAAVLAESVRLVDTVGRVGGDEFVLVAPGSAGATVARRVMDGIAALPAVAGRQISVSAGVARFPVDGTDADGLIAVATQALAQARAEGRGSVAGGGVPAG